MQAKMSYQESFVNLQNSGHRNNKGFAKNETNDYFEELSQILIPIVNSTAVLKKLNY